MTYITLETKRKLNSVGFSFPDYEKFLNLGMVYSYQRNEYVIGGFTDSKYSHLDEEVVQNGDWLPDSHQLLQWLQQCGFDISIRWDALECVFSISATCSEYGKFEAITADLVNGLGAIIYKICKTTQGKCSPERLFRLEIQNDSPNM